MMRTLALIVLLLAAVPVFAQEMALPDPALEQRARDLSREIRCVVCQSQSIADSDADIAKELRVLIREQIAEGKSDDDIRDYLAARYGDFVLFKPPFKASTFVLWVGPFAILVLAGIGVAMFFRRRAEAARPVDLSSDERGRVARLLNDEDGAA
jgi:cytochrome c-type biogenesis protein CcmH